MNDTKNKINKRKIVMVIPTLSTGGAEKFVYDMAVYLNKDIFDISVVVLYSKTGNIKEKKLENLGISIYYLNKKPGFSFRCIYNLKNLINRISPDIIHSHLDVILYLLPSYKQSQIKLHTVHSMAQFEARGIHKWIRKLAFGFFGVIPVAIGETVRESISSYYNIPLHQIPCIYNGVSQPCICEKDQHVETVFISVGTLYYVKNHELLLRAFKRVIELSKEPIRLNIVGDGELREVLLKQIEDLELNSYVNLIGWTNNVYSELQKADVYVCSSIVEGVSLSIIEAMSCGLPIIATNVGGNKDLVKMNVNGILFENNNEMELVEAMMKMVNDMEFQRDCGIASRELSKQLTIDKCVKQYEDLYIL